MTKKDKQSISTALLCMLLLALSIIVGMRAGWVSAEKKFSATSSEVVEMPTYDPLEVIVEHEYIYTPLPVDYETASNVTETELTILSQCVWGEYRGSDDDQVRQVAWCVLNRVDSPLYPDNIVSVVKQAGQFHGYSAYNPVDARIYALVKEVVEVWTVEKLPERNLPPEYLYFSGDGTVNTFRTQSGEIFKESLK